MGLVQFKIKKDINVVSYIKIIRNYDKNVSMSEIKSSIENNDFVYSFDLYGRDWMYIEGITEYEWHQRFYNLLCQLKEAGAQLDIFNDGKKEEMEYLSNWINTMKEIAEECEKYPD